MHPENSPSVQLLYRLHLNYNIMAYLNIQVQAMAALPASVVNIKNVNESLKTHLK